MGKTTVFLSKTMSIACIVFGIVALASSFFLGVFLILLGFIILPSTSVKILEKLKISKIKNIRRIAIIILLVVVLFISVNLNSKNNKSDKMVNNTTTTIAKTSQQILEESLSKTVKNIGGTSMDYRNIKIEKSDPNRPENTKMITVSIDISSFWKKDSLIRNTGEMASLVFQNVYKTENINAYDVIVWYYGEVTNKYGDKTNEVILTYAIDKDTYNKINWQNFDGNKLCEFLKQEEKTDVDIFAGCMQLVNLGE